MKETMLSSDVFTKTIFARTIGFMLVASIGESLADVADALLLGMRLGENGLAAISFVAPIYMLYNVLSFGIGTGGAICYAKLMGAGKEDEAVSHFNQMTWAALLVGIVTAGLGVGFLPQIVSIFGVNPDAGVVYQMTFEYSKILLLGAPMFFLHSLLLAFIRADDGTKHASAAFVTGSAVDICLNIVLVFWLDMGVVGAAMATVIGVTTCVIICLWYIWQSHTILKFSPCRLHLREILSSLGTGLATSTQSAWSIVLFIFVNNLLMQLGGISAVAVFDVTLSVSFFIMSPFTAIGETLRPMVATFVGERNTKAVQSTLHLSLIWGLVFGLVGITALWIFAEPLCLLFGISAEVAGQYGAFAIRCYLSSAVAGGICVTCMDYYQSINREKLAFFISFLRGFALYLPVAFLCGLLFGAEGIWVMFPVIEAVTLGFVILLYLWRRKHPAADAPTIPAKTWLLDADVQSIIPVLAEVEEFAEGLDATPRQAMRVVLMIEELCTAIIQVGFAKAQGCVQVTLLRVDNGDFELHIRDNAVSFNLFEAKTQNITSLEDDNEEVLRSLPLLLIRKNTKSHFYRRYQGFNTLLLSIGD